MKIVLSEPIHPSAVARLSACAEVVQCARPEDLDLSDADAVIVRAAKVTRAHLEKARHLKVIGKHGVGVNAIDVACARELGIPVVYTPTANSNAVAELAIGHMLAAARRFRGNALMLARGATRLAPPELKGLEMTGKVLGLVGYGHIGSRVAEIARAAFSMQVHVYDPYLPDTVLAAQGLQRARTVRDLMALADFISVHVPLTDETRGLVGAEELALCKKTAILVNTARGGVVDEDALCAALKEGRIFAAASDVFVSEPARPDHPLLSLDNFSATLHVGATTEEALLRVGDTVAEDVLGVLKGRPPMHPYTGPAPELR